MCPSIDDIFIYFNMLTPDRAGNLRKTFANPTPLAIVGFLLALTPLSCVLMGWRGAGSPAILLGGFYTMGGLCMLLGGLLEFFLGNTFPFVVFVSFGGFWTSFAIINSAYFGIGYYGTTATEIAASVAYNSRLAFYLIFWGVLCFIYFIISLRTNIVFAVIFISVDAAFVLLSATYWSIAKGHTALAGKLQIAGGACGFVCVRLS